MNNLLNSSLLQRDQKLNVLNKYIFPKLIHLLQVAPISKIPKLNLNKLNIIIRETAKGVIDLAIHNATSMLYSPRNFRVLVTKLWSMKRY